MTKRGAERIERRLRLGCSTVHILRNGFSVCLFTSEGPEDWPDGHRYQRVDQARHKVTCETCLKTAKREGF